MTFREQTNEVVGFYSSMKMVKSGKCMTMEERRAL